MKTKGCQYKKKFLLLLPLSLMAMHTEVRADNYSKQNQVVIQKKQAHSMISIENMDLSVRPQDDFFRYVNGKWVEKTVIPADKASWGVFLELRELTDQNSLVLLRELINKSQIKDTEAQKIKTAYLAFVDLPTRNQNAITPLNDTFSKIDQVTNVKELENLIIEFGKKGMNNPFYDWYVSADMKKSQENAVYQAGGFILLAKDYYQKSSAKNDEVIQKYQEFVAQILGRLGYSDAKVLAVSIVDFERQVAKNLLTNEQGRDASLQYNPRSISQLKHISKNVDLAKFLKSVGVNTNKVIIDEIKYFNNLDTYINQENLDLLKTYYKYWLVVQNHNVLDEAIDDAFFRFFDQYLQGQKEPRSYDKKALDFLNKNLGEALGKEYVKTYFSEASKGKMLELIGYLKRSYYQHIRELSWMSSLTKEKALHKLDKLNVKVAYPDKWKDFSQLKIDMSEKNIFDIKQAINEWEYHRMLEKVGRKVDKTEWAMPPQTVNAYYNPVKNEIVFPAGILQPPFFSVEADASMNFGGIGGVIAHEITHGFDDSGATFDSDGNLKNWWTRSDKIKFDALTKRLEEQYNRYEVLSGYFVNGKFTLGENIADLGGVSLAYDALQAYLKDKNIPQKSSEGNVNGGSFTENQKFFISWANIWRNKSTPEYLQNQVKVDPHSPAQIRAFAPLTNVDGFYEAFDVKPGDKLYKAPKDRIKIW